MDEKRRQKLIELVEIIKDVTGRVASGIGRTYDSDRVYVEVRRELLRAQELVPMLPKFLADCHTLVDFWAFVHAKFGLWSSAQRRDWIRQQFLPLLDGLEYDRLPTTTPPKEQQFFAPGTPHDGFVAIRDLVTTAQKTILVADNFVDATICPLLTNLPKGTSIRILTKAGNLKPDFLIETQKFAKQYGMSFEVRTTDMLHDRFIVCDDKRCWHLGASMKDLGIRAALISEITSQAISSAVRKELEGIWLGSKSA